MFFFSLSLLYLCDCSLCYCPACVQVCVCGPKHQDALIFSNNEVFGFSLFSFFNRTVFFLPAGCGPVLLLISQRRACLRLPSDLSAKEQEQNNLRAFCRRVFCALALTKLVCEPRPLLWETLIFIRSSSSRRPLSPSRHWMEPNCEPLSQ